MGLSPSELEGVEAALWSSAANLDNAGKLQMAIDLMPTERKTSVVMFMDELTALRTAQFERGQTALLAMTDDEWEAWINGDHESA